MKLILKRDTKDDKFKAKESAILVLRKTESAAHNAKKEESAILVLQKTESAILVLREYVESIQWISKSGNTSLTFTPMENGDLWEMKGNASTRTIDMLNKCVPSKNGIWMYRNSGKIQLPEKDTYRYMNIQIPHLVLGRLLRSILLFKRFPFAKRLRPFEIARCKLVSKFILIGKFFHLPREIFGIGYSKDETSTN